MISAISAAALAGLVGSPHCLGMCGSFALACGGKVSHTAAWHAGKILTYSGLGILAGLIGHSVPGPTWVATTVSATLVVWFAAGLAGIVPEPALRIPGLTRLATRAATRGDLGSRFLFGMATGLLPCGLVYATLGIAVASGDPLTGGLSMAAFGLGTAPALAALGLGVRRLAGERPWSRRVLAVLVLVAGLWVVFQRQAMTPERMMERHGAATHDTVTANGHSSARALSNSTAGMCVSRAGRAVGKKRNYSVGSFPTGDGILDGPCPFPLRGIMMSDRLTLWARRHTTNEAPQA